MKHIGIMGGTFNPIHNGHIEIAKAAYEQYKLDEVWFMPNHIPAYKSDEGIVSGEHRLKMISLSIEGYEYFKVSDFEILREGKTYSYETFTLLNKQYPNFKFYFIMGADSLFYFEKWVHPEMILQNAHILTASRDENGIEQINDRIHYLTEGHFDVIKCENTECSSSELRKCLHDMKYNGKNNKSYDYARKYIPSVVLDYINNNNLY